MPAAPVVLNSASLNPDIRFDPLDPDLVGLLLNPTVRAVLGKQLRIPVDDVDRSVKKLGQNLWERLIPAELKALYAARQARLAARAKGDPVIPPGWSTASTPIPTRGWRGTDRGVEVAPRAAFLPPHICHANITNSAAVSNTHSGSPLTT